jgi:CheY-like chemotaxis protein
METKILVADHSATIQKIVTMAFENESARVEGVSNGLDAFAKLAAFQPSIVLADTDMPGLTGHELSRKIKESEKFHGIKVLLLTSDFEDFDEAKFRECKADGHISKPFKSEDIVRKIREVLAAGGAPEETETLVLDASSILEESETPAMELSLDSVVEDFGGIEVMDLSATEIEQEPGTHLALSLDDMMAETPVAPEAPPVRAVDSLELEVAIPSDGVFEISVDDILNTPEPALEKTDQTEPPLTHDLPEDILPSVEPLNPMEMDDLEEEPVAVPKKLHVIDDLIQNLDHLVEPAGTAQRPNRGETDIESLDELDKTLQELKSQHQAHTAHQVEIDAQLEDERDLDPRLMKIKRIRLEPDDLLERMAPHAFARSVGAAGEKEKRPLFSEPAPQSPSDTVASAMGSALGLAEGRIDEIVAKQVRALVEKTLPQAIQSEMMELSETILDSIRDTVRQAVHDLAPRIVKEVIKEEIEQLRNM